MACVVMIGLFGGGMYTGVTTTSSVGGLATAIVLFLVSLFTLRSSWLVTKDLADGWNSDLDDPARTVGDNRGTESHDGAGEMLPAWGTWDLKKW